MDRDKIGQRLQKARKRAKVTLQEIAYKAGVSSSTVLRWESGTSIPAYAIPIIAKATNHPIEYFLLQDDELSESKIKSTAEVAALLGAQLEAKNKEIEALKAELGGLKG